MHPIAAIATALAMLQLVHAFHAPSIRLGPRDVGAARFCSRTGVRGLRAATGDAGSEMLLDGRVLFPGSDGEGWFDAQTTAMPVVLPPDEAEGRQKWLMYYYGVWLVWV